MGLRQLAAILVFVPMIVFGCYNPNISDRGYACGDHGECPTHFHCASNHLCYQGDASVDMPLVCNSVTTVQPTCSKGAASGQCNPICQTGCNNCGWCEVVGGAATCLTGSAGKKDVGTICDPSKESQCLPGLYCQPETCGTVTSGSCYRLCDPSDATNSICGTGSVCNVVAKKSGGESIPQIMLCTPICDPISQTSASCMAPFACYPSGLTESECDCAGTSATGQSCQLAEQCIPGDACAGPTSATVCSPICSTSVACASGTCNILGGATYGTCM
jgi:hypothetical protein